MTEPPKKKVVRVEHSETAEPDETATGPAWTPTPEAKSHATRLRLFAAVAWVLAIGVECFAIFWVLKQVLVNMWLLIGAIIVTGALSVAGSLLWKQSNRLDPASKNDKARFFVQNQLGAIIAIIAFLPLIILIFTNKNMDGKQKGIAGAIGIVVLLIAVAFGISYESPSQEQYAAETNIVQQLTGQDEVFWVKGGKVFHVCDAVPDVNKESKDGQIYTGTVADAHAAGKDRLVTYWDREAVKYCGYTQEQVDAVQASADTADTSSSTDDSEEPADSTGSTADADSAE